MSRENLKKARKEKGMTQQDMADYLGTSLRNYQSLEEGVRHGNFKFWDDLEDLFGMHQRKLREIQEKHHDP